MHNSPTSMKNSARLTALLLLASFATFAQSTTEERLWSKLTWRLEPTKDYTLDISGMYRGVSGDGIDRFITELQLGTSPSKNTKYSVEYRHYLMFDNVGAQTGIDHRARLRINGEQRYKLAPGDLYMRYGLQHREILTGGGTRKTDVRVRALYAHNIKNFKWDPEFYTEGLRTLGGDNDFRLRFGLSTGSKALGGKVNLGYFYQRNFTLTGPHYHTLTLGYRI